MDIANKVTGNQLTAAEFMQIVTELENSIEDTGIVLAAGTLDQVSKTMSNYSGGGDFYTDSGIADAYVCSSIGNKLGPTSYADGLRCRFIVGTTNTGASTINVNGLGAKNIVKEDTLALVAGDLVATETVTLVYDNANNRFYLETSTRLRRPFLEKGTVNIGIDIGGDASQLKITSSDHTALSTANPGYITMPAGTAGQLVTFKIVADVTIDLTGMHLGLDTFGNRADYPLEIHAINDNGGDAVLVFGVGAVPNLDIILDADDDNTAANIVLVDQVLVNLALNGDSPAMQIGWVNANFTDAGDEWAIQVGDGDINLGKGRAIWKPFVPAISNVGAITNVNIWWMKEEKDLLMRGTFRAGTVVGAAFDLALPVGFVGKQAQYFHGSTLNPLFGYFQRVDTGIVAYNASVCLQFFFDGADYTKVFANETGASDVAFNKVNGNFLTNNDSATIWLRATITGW